MTKYTQDTINKLNKDIQSFSHLNPIKESDVKSLEGVSRMVMLDRYAQKDKLLLTLGAGDIVVTTVKEDPQFPTRGIGKVLKVEGNDVTIALEDQYWGTLSEKEIAAGGIIIRDKRKIDKPLELFYEQIARRVGANLGSFEKTDKESHIEEFTHELASHNIIPAGRVLHGAGSDSQVTFFNCYVMPMPKDSRGGLADHRKEVMEIMSRGGGVGTNGSSLRPRGAAAIAVGGKSSGAVSWLNDLAALTNLVEQGGSRRGAQMIMLADWHPDIVEFIVSKVQNPQILKFLEKNLTSEMMINEIKRKLKFVPLTNEESKMYSTVVENSNLFDSKAVADAKTKLDDGGTWDVHNPDFLTGANISVAITKEFMEAVKSEGTITLKFPDVANLTKAQKAFYDEEWQAMGDVREWEKLGYPVKEYATIPAMDLWHLINTCATYSAEPGVFFMDRANEQTNAVAYDQKVVCTNPCGEQPLAPYSVCNLAAINLANFVDKATGEVQFAKLENTVRVMARLQDNVIDATPYFLDKNEVQAKGERRLGMGIMGLHDLLIWAGEKYGSPSANALVDKVMETIALTAYRTSIRLAKEKGAFPFLDSQEAREKMINSGYVSKLPQDIKDGILTHGIRNSHLLTIAPTGSTGTMVGVSTGLEPYFAFKYYRSGRLGKFMEVSQAIVSEWVEMRGNGEFDESNLPDIFVSAMELSPEDHADTQCVIQKWVDSSISKTVNAPKGYTVEQVEKIYTRLYEGGAKGGTVYVDGSRNAQVLSLTNDDAEKVEEQVDLISASEEVKDISLNLMLQEQEFNAQAAAVGPETDFSDSVIENKNVTIDFSAATSSSTNVGIEVGDTCPICEKGTVEEIGGCNTCTNCNAQLKCGL